MPLYEPVTTLDANRRMRRSYGNLSMDIEETKGPKMSSAGLSERERRILFRAWHRGTKEIDMLIGTFVESVLGTLDDEGLDALEHMMSAPDPECYNWIVGAAPVPHDYQTPMFDRLVAFHDLDKNRA